MKGLDRVVEESQIKLVGIERDSLNLLDKDFVVGVDERRPLVGIEEDVIGVKLELGEERVGIVRRKLDANLNLVILEGYEGKVHAVTEEKVERKPV
jgi:hypothetical protein